MQGVLAVIKGWKVECYALTVPSQSSTTSVVLTRLRSEIGIRSRSRIAPVRPYARTPIDTDEARDVDQRDQVIFIKLGVWLGHEQLRYI